MFLFCGQVGINLYFTSVRTCFLWSIKDPHILIICAKLLLLTIYFTETRDFTYRLDRLKPRASKFRGPPVKVYTIFNTVIGLSHLCCFNILYFLNNPSVIFIKHWHSISEYCRILNTSHHLHLYCNWLSTLPSSSSREGGGIGRDLTSGIA